VIGLLGPMLGVLGLYAYAVLTKGSGRARWDMPGVLAPESCFTPERLRDLCTPVYWDRRLCAPEPAFTPERLASLLRPVYWDRRVCAPESCFTPERLAALNPPVRRNRWHVCAPESAFTPERWHDLTVGSQTPWPSEGPDVYCPDGRDLWWEAMENIESMAPKRTAEEKKAGQEALAEFERGATP
jgi:hypothetical protein